MYSVVIFWCQRDSFASGSMGGGEVKHPAMKVQSENKISIVSFRGGQAESSEIYVKYYDGQLIK